MPLINMKAGRYKVPVEIIAEKGRLVLRFPFNRKLIDEVKQMANRRWHPEIKRWSVADCARNRFQIAYLAGQNPYQKYDAPLKEVEPRRDILMPHQVTMFQHQITRIQALISGEMGVGKTLSMIEALEYSGYRQIIWVGTGSSIAAVKLEFRKWKSKLYDDVLFLTYHSFRNMVKANDLYVPEAIVFDECQKLKGHQTIQSQMADKLTEAMRSKLKGDAFIGLMSGAPAPNIPADWFHICITGDSWILTDKGPKQVNELINKSINVRTLDKFYKTKGFFSTGFKQTYLLETEEGYSVKATPEHCFMKTDGSWCELQNLKTGDTLHFANYNTFNWDGYGSFKDGYLLGLLFGDGNIYIKKGNTYARLLFQDHDLHLAPKNMNLAGMGPWAIQNEYINNLIREFDFGPEKEITELFESSISSECMTGFISGFFDADGHNSFNRRRITLTQVNKDRIYTIQRMLTYFGIKSHIQKHKGNKGREIHTSKNYFVLHINNNEVQLFHKRISFGHKDKQPNKNLEIHDHINTKWATVKSITKNTFEEVYDITVPEIHAFSANGFMAHNCEVACPGYLREGDWWKFRDRLAVLSENTSASNQVYTKVETWLDDKNKCNVCGKLKNVHTDLMGHDFKESKNEVEYLYKRMEGLNIVYFKKDVLDWLPELQYRTIRLEPSDLMKKAERMIINTVPRTITTLLKLRELSDGFQYKEIETGEMEDCPLCNGSCTTIEYYDPEYPDEAIKEPDNETNIKQRSITCTHCEGKGTVPKLNRVANEIACAKEELLKQLLEEHEDTGRLVVYAGFQASVDRCVKIAINNKWNVIRADGRGWSYISNETEINMSREDMLERFQEPGKDKICFIGQAGAAGTGLTLTASPSIFFYSNSFNADDRIQAVNRIHRPGMDINKGATIIDCVHLDTDQYVLDNLNKKLDLLALSMGKFRSAVKDYKNVRRDDYVTV